MVNKSSGDDGGCPMDCVCPNKHGQVTWAMHEHSGGALSRYLRQGNNVHRVFGR